MRDLYIKDEDTLFRSSTCPKCGADKLTVSNKTLNEMKVLVRNDIACIMPMKTMHPEEGITYECKCNESNNFALVRKEIPIWIDRKIYDLGICPNCKGTDANDIEVRPVNKDVTPKDRMYDMELHCSRCHKSTNLSKTTIIGKTASKTQQDWDEYSQHLEKDIDSDEEEVTKIIKFEKAEKSEEDFFDLEEEYVAQPKIIKKTVKLHDDDDDLEISLDMDIDI